MTMSLASKSAYDGRAFLTSLALIVSRWPLIFGVRELMCRARLRAGDDAPCAGDISIKVAYVGAEHVSLAGVTRVPR